MPFRPCFPALFDLLISKGTWSKGTLIIFYCEKVVKKLKWKAKTVQRSSLHVDDLSHNRARQDVVDSDDDDGNFELFAGN